MSTVVADAGLLSLAALPLAPGADRYLPEGVHLRWNLSPELGFPYAGFRLRRRPAPVWPWPKSETMSADIGRRSVATSTAGVHVIGHPLRIEDAVVTPDFGLRCERRQPMGFYYEQRDRDDPLFQPWMRFAVALENTGSAARSIVRVRGYTVREGDSVQVAEARKPFRSLPVLDPEREQPSNLRVAFLSGAELHSIQLTAAEDIVVRRILYCTADHLHGQRDWETLEIFTPLCAAGTADVTAPADVRTLAEQRLARMRPLRRPTDAGAPGAGRRLSSSDHRRFEQAVLAQADTLAGTLSRAFRREIDQRTPPGRILLSDVDPGAIAADPPVASGAVDLPYYGTLQAGAFDSHVAAMLGLGFRDEPGGEDAAAWDYAIDALVSSMWLYASQLAPAMRERLDLRRLPKGLIVPGSDSDIWTTEPIGFQRLMACAVDQAPGTAAAIPAPSMAAALVPDASRTPVQASVALTLVPGNSGARPIVWRQEARTAHPISPRDPITGLLVAALSNQEGLCSAHDYALKTYGRARYRAANVDVFGRASRVATATCNVRDLIPPPAPAALTLDLGTADAGDENHFPAARTGFRWTPGMAAAAPDLRRFLIFWRAGFSAADDIVARPDGQTAIDWPPAAGQEIERGAEGVSLRNEIAVTALHSGVRREVSVACVAVDEAGNRSQPSQPAHAVVVDEFTPAAPAQPPEPQWSSWPDANGEVRWRCRWTLPPNAATTRVSRASETRLLTLSGTDKTAHYALPSNRRGAAVKRLAAHHPDAFVPEGLGYPASIKAHDIVMRAGSDDLCAIIVEFIGATGQKAPWPSDPDRFAVVRARPGTQPPTPRLQVSFDGRQATISAVANVAGVIDVFAIEWPGQQRLVDILVPIAGIPSGGSVAHSPTSESGWIGYIARLVLPDGRQSELCRPRWREVR